MQSLKTGAIFVSQEFKGIRDSKINDKTTYMLVRTPVPGPSPILTGSMDTESKLLNDNVSIVAKCPEIPVGGRLTHFFDRMGKNNFRLMGFRFDSGRLQTGIHSKTFFLRHKRNSYPKRSNHYVKKRNREYFKQK